jgi:hypothetical protein
MGIGGRILSLTAKRDSSMTRAGRDLAKHMN